LICTLLGPPTLDDLLDSLVSQDWIAGDEIIIVDNGMPKERRAQIEQRLEMFTPSSVSVQIYQEPQKGVVQARIKSIKVSRNPWLFSLDDDNFLEQKALSQIRQRLAEYPALGGICPRIEPCWEVKPERWVMALGHQVLSYNASELHEPPDDWHLWEPGVIGQRPPTGGMIISKSVAEEFVRLCGKVPTISRFTPSEGRRFTGEDFILYSLIYMRKDLFTAYDGEIIIRHQIPQRRMTFSYLLKTMFWSNYCFGLQGLMRFGKTRFIYVLIRGLGRLLLEWIKQSSRIVSLRVLFGYAAGVAGFLFGAFVGMVSRDYGRIHIDP